MGSTRSVRADSWVMSRMSAGLIAMSTPRAPIFLCLRNSASAVAARVAAYRSVISGEACLICG